MSTPAAAPRAVDPSADPLVIDARAPRFNQLVVATLSVGALVTGFWPLLALVGAQLAITVIFGRRACLPCLAYFAFLQPRFGEGPLKDARATRFANFIGAVFLLAAALAWGAGFPGVGQALGGLVAGLAALAAVTGLCVGCAVYGVLARLRGVRGGLFDLVDLEQLGVLPESELVVLFTHPLCSECQDVAPRLEREGRRVVTVDVSKRRDLAKKYGVTLVPLAVAVGADGRVRQRLG
jgi:hypothetical protein